MATSLRVMSANLCWGRADPECLLALVRRLEVDVVGLQELGCDQAEAVSQELPYGVLSPSNDSTGTGVALRRPAKIDVIPMAFRPLHTALLDPADWPALDACEPGYLRQRVRLRGEDAEREADTYVSPLRSPEPVAFEWYKQLIVAGAREHALPAAWLDFLEGLPSRPDPARR